jgi:preprotein translocase subunit SecA
MAFEQFLAALPTHMLAAQTDGADAGGTMDMVAPPMGGGQEAAEAIGEPEGLQFPARREATQVGRNEPCPCGSGKKFKNCCGRTA